MLEKSSFKKLSWANDKIIRSALASKLAYTHDTKKIMLLHGTQHCVGECNIVESKAAIDAHAYMWKNGSHSYLVAFRGSRNVKDMMQVAKTAFKSENFNIQEESVLLPSVLYDMFRSLEEFLTMKIFVEHVKKITFCGHSLGGALASVMATYYATIFPQLIVELHTFGAPKLHDPAFYNWRKRRVHEAFDFVHSQDIVPQLVLGNPLKIVDNPNEIILDKYLAKKLVCKDPFCTLETHDLECYIECLVNILQHRDTHMNNQNIILSQYTGFNRTDSNG
jgi:hypothetical protein